MSGIPLSQRDALLYEVGRCRLTPLWPRTDPAWFQCRILKYSGPLSNFAFNCNLRHYNEGGLDPDALTSIELVHHVGNTAMRRHLVGQCRLSLG